MIEEVKLCNQQKTLELNECTENNLINERKGFMYDVS